MKLHVSIILSCGRECPHRTEITDVPREELEEGIEKLRQSFKTMKMEDKAGYLEFETTVYDVKQVAALNMYVIGDDDAK